jgi:hypothetical protein
VRAVHDGSTVALLHVTEAFRLHDVDVNNQWRGRGLASTLLAIAQDHLGAQVVHGDVSDEALAWIRIGQQMQGAPAYSVD